jgi:nucleoside 2-deoxyribosyltransferase
MLRAFNSLKIYLASSSRNILIDDVIVALRAQHEVYDFRAAGREIFDPTREIWTPEDYVEALTSQAARAQFAADLAALNACDCLVLVTPAGNDSHLELGYAHGRNIPTIIFLNKGFRAGLMNKVCSGFVSTIPDLLFVLSLVVPRDAAATGNLTAAELNPFPLPSSRWA